MTDLRVGVVGAGGIATRHLGNLTSMPSVQVVGVADPVVEAAQTLAARTAGARAFADWRAMLDEAGPEALVICIPPFAHGDPELAAIELGLPFFVEKPVSADLATAERIASRLEAKPVVTAVGYHWRYLDTTERAADLLVDRPAQLVMGYWWDATPPRSWWVSQSLSGGQMVEQTTHLFDLARHLVGEAEVVSALARHVPGRALPFDGADVADASLASVVFASGAIGMFASTHLPRWPHRIALHTVSDGMVIELTEQELMVDVGRGRPVVPAERDPFVAEMRDFVTAASGGDDRVRTPYAEALRTQRLTVAATQAARSPESALASPSSHEPAPAEL